MNVQRPEILILDMEQTPCSAGCCDRLPKVIQEIVPTAKICQKQSPSELGAQAITHPDLILLRTSAPRQLPDLTSALKNGCPDSSLMGVFCLDTHQKLPIEGAWVNELNDFICCPCQEVDLALRVKRIFQIQNKASKALSTTPADIKCQVDGLIGQSNTFLRALQRIRPLAESERTVLITGETGTGKELFARAIHYKGPRMAGPFLPVNCGALPDHLFENELFGHAKGAFTDAASEQKGLIQEAEGGTLFLDEIDALSLAAQIKLLRFLQDGEYRPLGSAKSLGANVRVLAATNRDVKYLVQKNLFREDLYYRINTFSLFLSPLRDRQEDIPLLANHFLARIARQGGRAAMQLSSRALGKLAAYTWPGNARELEAIIQRAATFCASQTVQPEDIELPIEAPQAITECCLRNAKRQAVEQFERTYLINLLTTHHGNVSQAAKASGKERRSFQRLLGKHNLNRTAFLGAS